MVESKEKIRVVLVDDHPLTREGLRACLGVVPHLEVVAEASNGAEALRTVRRVTPDVVLMDLNMPRMNGLVATRAILRERPQVHVLVLTMHDHPEYIVEVIRAGARGYLSKDIPPAELIRVIEKIAAGDVHFGLTETVRYMRRYSAAAPCEVAPPIKGLTAREREVIALVAQGLTNRQISARLAIAVRTVETHRERLMRKLDIHDASGLRFYAAAHGLAGAPDRVSIGD